MKKILVIEDNAEVRENTAEIIALADYEVITAENGKLGTVLARKELPDLIVCDIMMPVLDGYGVFHLLSRHPQTASIPFIFLTAKSEKTDFRKGMDMGADDYIVKPFEGVDLLNAIEVRLKKVDASKPESTDSEKLNDLLENALSTENISLATGDREVFSYSKKQTIYTEGQRPRAVYHIVSGKVKIAKTNDEGKEYITSLHGPGEYFGYTAVVEDAPYTDEAQALEETKLMLIPREDFIQLLSKNRSISQRFIKLITHDIIEKEEDLLNLAYGSLRKKVAYGLIQLLETYKTEENGKPVISLSREHMAQSIGIATESLVRTLGDFKDEKLVDVQTGKVTILKEKTLRALPF